MKPDIIQTVTRLPNELSPAFMEWCLRGGHSIKVKKDRVCVHKDQKRGEVICKPGVIQESYAMNEYMIERFQLFSRQWLKYGKSFVNELDQSMMGKYSESVRRFNLAKVA